MANPIDLQPGRTPSASAFPGSAPRAMGAAQAAPRAIGTAPSQPHLLRVLHAFIGLLSLSVLAIAVAAPYITTIPRARFETFGGVSEFRLWGVMVFTALLMLRFMFSPPRKLSHIQLVWGHFAVACAGAMTEERRREGPLGRVGGPTVRWSTRGVDVRLWTLRDSGLDDHTLFSADVRLARGYQFLLAQESMPAKTDPSGHWSLGEVLLGDSRFDESFLLKSDAVALAREFFGDPGVEFCLHQLHNDRKGWRLTLASRERTGTHRLLLSVPGLMIDPEALDSSRRLIEASIRCFADRGMLASGISQAT
jgi:hypothetical protein